MTATIGAGSAETSTSLNQLSATASTSPDADKPALSSYSRFVQRLRRRYAGELALLPEGSRAAHR